MIKINPIACLLVCCCLHLRAQVTVEIVLPQEQFLPNEEIIAAVRVTNFSGQTLLLGQDDDWLQFAVEGGEGRVVERVGEIPVKSPFQVESGKIGIRRVDIAPFFNLGRAGRYLLQVTVEIPELAQRISSRPARFDIVSGTKLWEQSVGVPLDGSRTNSTVELRKFILQQAIYLKEMKLYLRITDVSEAVVYRVFPLGPMVSFSRPDAQVDRESRLHVLYQTGAKAYLYAVVGPKGDLQVRQTHEITETRPALKVNTKGVIYVSGGGRRVTLGDIPSRLDPVAPKPATEPPPSVEPEAK